MESLHTLAPPRAVVPKVSPPSLSKRVPKQTHLPKAWPNLSMQPPQRTSTHQRELDACERDSGACLSVRGAASRVRVRKRGAQRPIRALRLRRARMRCLQSYDDAASGNAACRTHASLPDPHGARRSEGERPQIAIHGFARRSHRRVALAELQLLRSLPQFSYAQPTAGGAPNSYSYGLDLDEET